MHLLVKYLISHGNQAKLITPYRHEKLLEKTQYKILHANDITSMTGNHGKGNSSKG